MSQNPPLNLFVLSLSKHYRPACKVRFSNMIDFGQCSYYVLKKRSGHEST
jgi:hypothetical protein